MTDPLTWRTSSFCHGGDCVAVAQAPDGAVHMAATGDPDRQLVFDAVEWRDFIAGVKNGEFDPT